MLFNVPGATSPGLPATVTSPRLAVCLNCRCDPHRRTTDQPSSCSILTTPRIFTMRSTPRSACVREQPSAHTAQSGPLPHEALSRTNIEATLRLAAARTAPKPRGRTKKLGSRIFGGGKSFWNQQFPPSPGLASSAGGALAGPPAPPARSGSDREQRQAVLSSGNRTVIVAPRPNPSLAAATVPSCAVTNAFTTASPTPSPVPVLVAR